MGWAPPPWSTIWGHSPCNSWQSHSPQSNVVISPHNNVACWGGRCHNCFPLRRRPAVVDAAIAVVGKLHLSIQRIGRRWFCSHFVIRTHSWGGGRQYISSLHFLNTKQIQELDRSQYGIQINKLYFHISQPDKTWTQQLLSHKDCDHIRFPG